jgi:putative hydrolase of the HAD superfamily
MKNMTKIKTILFDLDNTLIDFIKMKRESCQATAKAMIKAGFKMDHKTAYRRLMSTYFRVGIESDRIFTKFLEKEGQFDHKILAAAINAYLKAKNKYLKPYKNVKTTLNKLKKMGITLVIVTDAPKTKAYQRLLAMDIESYFDFVIGFEDTGKTKRDGFPLQMAIDKLQKMIPNLQNDEILMVGDSIIRDLHPAQKFGLQTALAKYGEIRKERGTTDYELRDISEIFQIIN